MIDLTRRQFIAASAVAPFAASFGAGAHSRQRRRGGASAAPDLGSIRLTDGAFVSLAGHNRDFLQGPESDRLLHTFRPTAGLASRAEPLGGGELATGQHDYNLAASLKASLERHEAREEAGGR